MDILNALGKTAENILDGNNRVIDVDEFSRLWEKRETNDVFLSFYFLFENFNSFHYEYLHLLPHRTPHGREDVCKRLWENVFFNEDMRRHSV